MWDGPEATRHCQGPQSPGGVGCCSPSRRCAREEDAPRNEGKHEVAATYAREVDGVMTQECARVWEEEGEEQNTVWN